MRTRSMSANDMWSLPRVGSPVLSPDGTFFVVPVTTYSVATNKGTTRLWRVPADARDAGSGGRDDPATPLTTAEVSSSQPALSPDGTRLAFVRKPGRGFCSGSEAGETGCRHTDVPQLYLMSLSGGEPRRLTDLPLGVADPRWFPHGRFLAFLSYVYPNALSVEATEARKKELEKDPVKPLVTEDRVYRFWDQWLIDGKIPHIFALNPDTDTLLDLMPESLRWFDFLEPVEHFAIAPDGREIAYTAARSEPPHDPFLWGVFTLRVPARIAPDARPGRKILLDRRIKGNSMRPVYSPNGRYLLYGFQKEYDFYADKVRLAVYDREERKHTVLTEEWDRSAQRWTFGADGRDIYLLSEHLGHAALFSLDLLAVIKRPSSHPPREIRQGGTFTAPRPSRDRIFSTLSSLTAPPEVYSCDRRGDHLLRHTFFTRESMQGLSLARIEEVTFAGAENERVQMLLLHPSAEAGKKSSRRRTPRKKLPLVHMIHGGPHGTFGDMWHWRWNAQLFAAPGYLVALVNFHGSTSWGQGFTRSILGRWGDQPYRDIMAATDHLIGMGLVDEKRMAVAGGSYGGFLVAWIASQTDRFACIVNHAGVVDFQTQFGSDITQGRARSLGGEAWKNIEGMDRYNPMRHAKGFKSPMLIIHGGRDYRVPHAQALEIYNVYKARKLPARLVFYPDENHWILNPRNSCHWYDEVLSWLERWIGKDDWKGR